jgi:hypothetical protein
MYFKIRGINRDFIGVIIYDIEMMIFDFVKKI